MSATFFQNKSCEYFPCHKIDNEKDFNCLFCYCPLYSLGESCGGNPIYTKKGIKSCMKCTLVHKKEEGLAHIKKVLPRVLEKVKKS